MSNVFKKVVSVGVTMSTLFWSVGVSALLPTAASAASCPSYSAGDLVKVVGAPAIYAVNADGKVLFFPNGDAFKSWNADETYSQTRHNVTEQCYDALPWPTGTSKTSVGFRAGSFVVKRQSSSQLYVVLPGSQLAKITASAASALYGANYKVKVLEDSSVPSYTMSASEITEAKVHPGMLVSNGGKTWYVDSSSMLHEVTAAGMSANRFKSAFVRPVTSAMIAGLSVGEAYTALVPAAADRTQSGVTPGTSVPSTGGALSVALDASNPAGVNLADKTALNPVLKVSLRAGSAAVRVTGLTLTKSGFLANTAVSGIEVVDSSGRRHGNVASSVNADGQVTLLFTGDPITVSANGAETVTVRVNLSDVSANGTLRFGLASASAVASEGNASVSGSFPVSGNEFVVYDGSNSVAAVKIDVAALNPTGATLNVDELNWQDITKFSLEETSSKEKVLLKEWTLYNNGTASDSDVRDVQLVAQDGSVLSTAQQINKTVRFMFASPYEIDKGQSKTFTVRAKIVGGPDRTIQFTTYNDYDVVVSGQSTSANVLPTATGSIDTSFPVGNTSAAYNRATVGSGTVSFNKDVTSPSNAVTPGATNVVLAKYYVKPTGENMELRKLDLGFVTTTNGSLVLTGSFVVRVNGAAVYNGTPTDVANSASSLSTVTLSTYPTLVAGQNNYITVEGNISNTSANGSTHQVYMKVNEVKRVITNDITTTNLGSIVGANQISVQGVALRVTNLSTPVTQSVVVGSTNVELANLELNAGVVSSGEDVKVSSIVVSQDGNGGTAGTVTDFSNLVLYGADGMPLATSASTATGAASTTFNFVTPIIVPKNGSVVLKLRGDVLGNTNGNAHYFAIRNASAHVSAVGKETGNSLTSTTLTGGSGNGQSITTTATGVLTLSMVAGAGATPSNDQIVTPGQTNVSVFAFKLTAQNEPIKLTTLRLMASGTTWTSTNNLVNLKLYRNSETQPFASASQMLVGPGSETTSSTIFTWTATDNILPEAVQPGSPVTIYVKADVGVTGQVKLGEGFQFGISSTSTANVVAKGASSGTVLDNNDTSKVSGAPMLATGVTYIAPFQVLATAEAPAAGSSVTQAVIAGTQIARIKIQNNGSAKVTITGIKFTDSGSHTGASTSYTLKYSDQNSNNYVQGTASSTLTGNGTADSNSNGTNWKTNYMIPVEIDGGSYRYFTVTIGRIGDAVQGDNFQLAVASLGDITYSVAETDLGYDANLSGTLAGSITGLFADGKPIMGTLVKQ